MTRDNIAKAVLRGQHDRGIMLPVRLNFKTVQYYCDYSVTLYINSEEKVSEAINSSPKKYAKCF